MKMIRTASLATVSAAALLALAACGNNETKVEKAPTDAMPADSAAMAPVSTEPMVGGVAMNPADNIVANASKAPNLTTLVAAVQAAGLAATLQGAGPFLTYHVVPGRLTAADIAAEAQKGGGTASLTTVQGEKLTIRDAGGGRWTITDAKGGTSTITQADVGQSNGVVHVIDTVLMPK